MDLREEEIEWALSRVQIVDSFGLAGLGFWAALWEPDPVGILSASSELCGWFSPCRGQKLVKREGTSQYI